ncbi:UvrD-helicase domain-containing protein [Corynebacterium sanguinis]|uniref:3'-5' exonuclease n=1 Tax=Corynebacterium sanguinis TaxID=2594913 RepID=UPI0021B03DA4|nr:3'-5' exonuclease [Corynebacterium sanguinis]MCT1555592.1 UvrD-helicase domain-containing protein [Corynebacterium sanguinis]MCT1664771.1 UvrD-helicase domain-containing protein [Corynebacterium sanguinis]
MAAIVTFYKTFKDRYNLGKQVMGFVQKLIANPASPSLHVEPITQAPDKRVRTARVNKQFRAVMFELEASGEKHFVLVDILNHDDAYAFATTKTLKLNHINGVTEVADVDTSNAESASRAKREAAEAEARLQAEQETEEQTPAAILRNHGVTEQQLVDELGLSEETRKILRTAPSADTAEDWMLRQPSWEQIAVTGLLTGISIDEIRHELGLNESQQHAATIDDPDSDEALVAGMNTAAAKMEFIVAPDQDELEAILSSGSFDDWRVFLHPDQRRAVEADFSGSARVTGGAGTGKTVVVVHRTKYLLDKNPHARVLLTTYTRDLADALKRQMNILDPKFPEASVHGAPGLWISGVDALVSSVLANAQQDEIAAGLAANFGIETSFVPGPLGAKEERKLWQEAVQLKGANLSPEKANPTFLSQEYSTVILTHGINNERDYLRVRRAGRGTSLSRAERKAVWSTVEVFHNKCATAKRLTFAAMAVLAADVVEHRHGAGMFDHVLIDEAQDFHAGHWRFLRACAVEGPNDIFIAEDSHQRIYGQRLVLAHYGINTRGRASTKLRVNYRTTAQNLGYASAILDNTEWIDSEEQADDLHGYRSVRQGPAPVVIHNASNGEEADRIAELIDEWIEDAAESGTEISIGVLTRTNQRKWGIEAQLGEHDIPLATGRVTSQDKPVAVTTMHNAKGLEFTHVILADVSAQSLPQNFLFKGLAPAERDDTLQRERALLYVAASRARDHLVVSVVGEPSELLPPEAA